MTQKVAFNSLEAARSVRTDARIRPFLAESDDARTATVTLTDETPAVVAEDVEGQAAETRAEEAEKFGQVALTESERDRIDFTRTTVPEARAAKGIAVGKGVGDFVSFFDPELTVDEHREVFEAAATESGGQRGGRAQLDEREVDRKIATGFEERQRSELDRAKEFAFEDADPEAREFLESRGSRSEVFDISFAREGGVLSGRGEDFDRLLDRHESRSSRAQTLDEKQMAPVTRDPFEWLDSPAEVDFPGIDTVDPVALHAERSDHARAVDERELAPIADTREEWALSPDELDFPGVDTPNGEGSSGQEDVLDTSMDTQTGLGGDVVEQDTQASFDLQVEDTPETRLAEESASTFGVDDRTDPTRGTMTDPVEVADTGLEEFGGGSRQNKSLDDLL